MKRKNWDLTLKWMSSFLKYFTSAEWIIYYHLVSKHQHGKIKHDMHSQYEYFWSKIRQKNRWMSVIKCIICPTWSFLLSAGNWWQLWNFLVLTCLKPWDIWPNMMKKLQFRSLQFWWIYLKCGFNWGDDIEMTYWLM